MVIYQINHDEYIYIYINRCEEVTRMARNATGFTLATNNSQLGMVLSISGIGVSIGVATLTIDVTIAIDS